MRATSHIFSTMRGKVGGIVYSTTPDHQIIARAYAQPVNPNTDPQGFIRGDFSGAVDLWRSMSQDVRDGWQNWAQANGGISRNGRKAFIGGYTVLSYIYNQYKGTSGFQAPLVTPPNIDGSAYALYSSGAYSGVVGQSGYAFKITNPADFPAFFLVQASIGFGGARQRYNGPWNTSETKLIEVDGGDTVITNVGTQEPETMVHFLRIRPIIQLREPLPGLRGDLVGPVTILRCPVSIDAA